MNAQAEYVLSSEIGGALGTLPIRQQRAVINHGEIGLLANIERPERSAFAEGVRGSLRGEVQRVGGRWDLHICLVKRPGFLRFDRAPHHPPEIQLWPRGHIAAEADMDTGSSEFIERQDAAAEKEICGGAVRDTSACRRNGFAFPIAEVNAVAEHRLRPQQSILRVNVSVIGSLGKEVPHFLDLGEVFGEMRLDVGVVLTRQIGCTAH